MVDTASPNASPLTDPSRDGADRCVCGAAQARTERHLRNLEELAEIGMDLARTVQRQAHEQTAADAGAADVGLAFSRIARAVRQTVALEARLAEDHQAQAAARRAKDTHTRAARRRREVKAIVGQAIEADADESDVESLLLDLEERLADRDEEADFADLPIGELVARICRDLGVTPGLGPLRRRRLGHRGSPHPTTGLALCGVRSDHGRSTVTRAGRRPP